MGITGKQLFQRAAFSPRPVHLHALRRQRGFSLLELLVVLVIVGITLGMVTLNVMPNGQKALQDDAQRVALLLQLARDEAIVRDRPVAFEADENHYDFQIGRAHV